MDTAITLLLMTLAPASGPLEGSAGVCIRWAEDPHHVADAVVVQSSGNRALDAALPASIVAMDWPAPTGEDYAGEWIGIRMTIGSAPAADEPPLPDCSDLPLPQAPRDGR